MNATFLRSKMRSVLDLSKNGIVGSNPARGMDEDLCSFCVCVMLSMGRSPVQGAYKILNRFRVSEVNSEMQLTRVSNTKKTGKNCIPSKNLDKK